MQNLVAAAVLYQTNDSNGCKFLFCFVSNDKNSQLCIT